MKIRFENMRVVLSNGVAKIKYTLGSIALAIAYFGLSIYTFKKSGIIGLLKLWIATFTVEAGAYGYFFYKVACKEESNWFTKLYSKAADLIGYSWEFEDAEQ